MFSLDAVAASTGTRQPGNPAGPLAIGQSTQASQSSYIIGKGMLEVCRGLLDDLTLAHKHTHGEGGPCLFDSRMEGLHRQAQVYRLDLSAASTQTNSRFDEETRFHLRFLYCLQKHSDSYNFVYAMDNK